jgi:hypothetical protein
MVSRMMTDDGIDNRSGFFRRLIRMKYARRYSQPNILINLDEIH